MVCPHGGISLSLEKKRKGSWHRPQHRNLEDWVLSYLTRPSPSLSRPQAFDPSAVLLPDCYLGKEPAPRRLVPQEGLRAALDEP